MYEEWEALIYANYNPTEWKKLPWEYKALAVAHYRNARLVKLHGQDAAADKVLSENKMAQASKGSK